MELSWILRFGPCVCYKEHINVRLKVLTELSVNRKQNYSYVKELQMAERENTL